MLALKLPNWCHSLVSVIFSLYQVRELKAEAAAAM
jgi:hypothetical protein